jgi:hypothetical protein
MRFFSSTAGMWVKITHFGLFHLLHAKNIMLSCSMCMVCSFGERSKERGCSFYEHSIFTNFFDFCIFFILGCIVVLAEHLYSNIFIVFFYLGRPPVVQSNP